MSYSKIKFLFFNHPLFTPGLGVVGMDSGEGMKKIERERDVRYTWFRL
jgi:hypothetical protein